MSRNYRLYDFMQYPNYALSITFASPFQWSGFQSLKRERYLQFLMRLAFVFGVVNMIYQNFGMIIYLFKNTDDDDAEVKDSLEALGQISETGGIMGLTLVGVCKMWIIFWHEKRIRVLLEAFERLFPNSKQRQDYNFYRVNHFARRSTLLMKRTATFFMSAFVFYNSLPIIELLYQHYTPGLTLKYHCQSFTWYPWHNAQNRKSWLSYIITYICQMQSSLTGVAFIMAGEFLLCFFTTQMQMHFEYVANALEALDATSKHANERLKFLLNYHERLLRYAKEINHIFNISFLVNFATSSIAICLMGFSMVMISPAHACKYAVGLMAFLVFTFLICYQGNELTDASKKLMPAAFYNNWYEGDYAYRKMILFFIMRSQEPYYLHAYKFSTVSMKTYMGILKFSYRLFTFFRAMG